MMAFITVTITAACTLSKASGVSKLGPDTYTTSAAAVPAGGGPSEARRIALTEANAHCDKLGQQIIVLKVGTEVTNIHGAGKAEVVFRCLSDGDPELRRPQVDQLPERHH
jgi:hypothetical protein